MSFHEGSKWQEQNEDRRSVGGCSKHRGQLFINCPMCAAEKNEQPKKNLKTLQELAVENNLSGDELTLVSCYLVALRMHKKGIEPERFMQIVENWERIEKAIRILNFDFNL